MPPTTWWERARIPVQVNAGGGEHQHHAQRPTGPARPARVSRDASQRPGRAAPSARARAGGRGRAGADQRDAARGEHQRQDDFVAQPQAGAAQQPHPDPHHDDKAGGLEPTPRPGLPRAAVAGGERGVRRDQRPGQWIEDRPDPLGQHDHDEQQANDERLDLQIVGDARAHAPDQRPVRTPTQTAVAQPPSIPASVGAPILTC